MVQENFKNEEEFAAQKYDYGKRAEYQVARLETTYLKQGDNWKEALSRIPLWKTERYS